MKQEKEKAGLHAQYAVNEQIKSDQIRLITEDGENLGIVSKKDALLRAQQAGLDLVKIGEQVDTPQGTIVVAKVMDFGKYLYMKKKEQTEAKKHQKVIQIKEIKIRPNIGDQDYLIKINRATDFFKEGKRVKFTLQFRGREMIMMKDLGTKLFDKITHDLEERKIGTLVAEKEQLGKAFWTRVYYIKS